MKYKKIVEKKLNFKMKCLKSFVLSYLICLGGVDRLFSLIFQSTMFMGRRKKKIFPFKTVDFPQE